MSERSRASSSGAMSFMKTIVRPATIEPGSASWRATSSSTRILADAQCSGAMTPYSRTKACGAQQRACAGRGGDSSRRIVVAKGASQPATAPV